MGATPSSDRAAEGLIDRPFSFMCSGHFTPNGHDVWTAAVDVPGRDIPSNPIDRNVNPLEALGRSPTRYANSILSQYPELFASNWPPAIRSSSSNTDLAALLDSPSRWLDTCQIAR